MKFLANENFPAPSIKILRAAGLDVVSISEMSPGISDLEVVRKAKVDNSIILTFDKDYGEIIFKHESKSPPPVIFFRYKGDHPEYVAQSLLSLLKTKGISVENIFTVIEQGSIRQRKYG